jgi:hypothetical protein
MYNQERTRSLKRIDAGKVVNTALATAKDPKEKCNGYLWNYRDERYAHGYPLTKLLVLLL